MTAAPVIEVRDLTIDYETSHSRVRAVDRVGFSLAPSEVLGLVGESGSGKSTVARALLGHVAPAARVVAGGVFLRGENLLEMPAPALASCRGRRIGFVPQNPATGLSPNRRVGAQLAEVALHHGVAKSREEAMSLAMAQFALVGLPEPERLIHRYPHEMSGGQQQRVCIAIAFACRPELLVLDEPTTGLDVTTQARIVDLLRQLRAQSGIGMLYVTHDLALLAQIADRVGVMYAGRLIETATVERLFAAPRHPYSRALIASIPNLDHAMLGGHRLRGVLERKELPPGCPFFPRCDHAEPSCAHNVQELTPVGPDQQVACQRWSRIPPDLIADEPELPGTAPVISRSAKLLEFQGVSLSYGRPSHLGRLLGRRKTEVVEDLSLFIAEGEIFALVGESGSGKSTIARAIAGLLAPRRGWMRFRDVPLSGRLNRRDLETRREIQYVFQNPDTSLNPRERVLGSLARPLRLYFSLRWPATLRRTTEILREVRLDPSFASRYPDQLSGGERQRVAIARGLVARPALMLCDEILSGLDVSVQASVIDLLARVRRETGVAMLFISHDLAIVRHLADRTGVLFRGALVECGPTEALFESPFHPYTEELLLAVPAYRKRMRPVARAAKTETAIGRGRGCVYAGRCWHYLGRICDEKPPPWRETAAGHAIRCHIELEDLLAKGLIAGRTNHGGTAPQRMAERSNEHLGAGVG